MAASAHSQMLSLAAMCVHIFALANPHNLLPGCSGTGHLRLGNFSYSWQGSNQPSVASVKWLDTTLVHGTSRFSNETLLSTAPLR
jgi:hypothetical protein